MDITSLDLSGSLDLLFPRQEDKENLLEAFSKIGDSIEDPYKDLSSDEIESMNQRIKMVSNKIILPIDEYVSDNIIIEPDLSGITPFSEKFEVLKKLPNYEIGAIVNASDLTNLEFLLKFNIIKEV
jgi:hypothetical protein